MQRLKHQSLFALTHLHKPFWPLSLAFIFHPYQYFYSPPPPSSYDRGNLVRGIRAMWHMWYVTVTSFPSFTLTFGSISWQSHQMILVSISHWSHLGRCSSMLQIQHTPSKNKYQFVILFTVVVFLTTVCAFLSCLKGFRFTDNNEIRTTNPPAKAYPTHIKICLNIYVKFAVVLALLCTHVFYALNFVSETMCF